MIQDARGNKMEWTADQPIIRVREVHKSFGKVEVLRGVSFDVMKGEVVCIIGPSGSGKSTLLRLINALVSVDSGSVQVAGVEVHDLKLDKIALRGKVGMVFQQYNLFPHMTVMQNLMLGPLCVLKKPQAEAESHARRLLARVRLEAKADAYPGQLSGGQQQRVAIARALMMDPDVILFDEVTAALDPEMVKEVLVTIRELAQDGMTCLIVTHEMGFARGIASVVLFTDHGIIVERGKPQEIFDSPSDARTREFLSQILH